MHIRVFEEISDVYFEDEEMNMGHLNIHLLYDEHYSSKYV